MDKKGLIELAKSFARFIYFGVLGLIGTWITSLIASGSLDNTKITVANTTISVGLFLVAALGFLAKAIDRYIHKSDSINANGIVPGPLQ